MVLILKQRIILLSSQKRIKVEVQKLSFYFYNGIKYDDDLKNFDTFVFRFTCIRGIKNFQRSPL